MSHCRSLGEATAIATKAKNVEEIIVLAELEHAFGGNPTASDGGSYAVSPNAEDDLGEGASDSVKPWTCYFGSSTITVRKIKEMDERGYFPEGESSAPGTRTMPEPNGDKDVVYEDFFIASLCMPPHPALADILLHFQA
jgi:hypothetical protein